MRRLLVLTIWALSAIVTVHVTDAQAEDVGIPVTIIVVDAETEQPNRLEPLVTPTVEDGTAELPERPGAFSGLIDRSRTSDGLEVPETNLQSHPGRSRAGSPKTFRDLLHFTQKDVPENLPIRDVLGKRPLLADALRDPFGDHGPIIDAMSELVKATR